MKNKAQKKTVNFGAGLKLKSGKFSSKSVNIGKTNKHGGKTKFHNKFSKSPAWANKLTETSIRDTTTSNMFEDTNSNDDSELNISENLSNTKANESSASKVEQRNSTKKFKSSTSAKGVENTKKRLEKGKNVASGDDDNNDIMDRIPGTLPEVRNNNTVII